MSVIDRSNPGAPMETTTVESLLSMFVSFSSVSLGAGSTSASAARAVFAIGSEAVMTGSRYKAATFSLQSRPRNEACRQVHHLRGAPTPGGGAACRNRTRLRFEARLALLFDMHRRLLLPAFFVLVLFGAL